VLELLPEEIAGSVRVAVKGPAEEVEKPPPEELVERAMVGPALGAGVLRPTVIDPDATPAVSSSLVGLKLSEPEGGGGGVVAEEKAVKPLGVPSPVGPL
jgi:hypothetical protein